MITLDKIGSDPEFGILDPDGNPIPSFIFFEGTKQYPEDMGNGFSILKDNLLVEGNIPACKSKQEFIDAMKFLKGIIQIPLNRDGSALVSADILDYHPMWINTPDGQEFGCSNFRNAYSDKDIQTPVIHTNTRELGMHVHISYITNNNKYKVSQYNKLIAKAMDFFLGIPSDKIHYSKERRESYGVLGSYRNSKIYQGMEYRSLGGYFTKDEYLPWIYDQTVKAMEFCAVEENLTKLESIESPDEKYYKLLGIKLEEQVPTLIKV